MFDSSIYLNQFIQFLQSKKPFLSVLEESDFKRISFLNDVIEQINQMQRYAYFRLNSSINFEDLIHQITDRFVIPVRSVHVSLKRQLEDQADILWQMNQPVIFFIEDAHQLSLNHLRMLLELSAYCSVQSHFPSLRVILLGKPSLLKRLISLDIFSQSFKDSLLSFTVLETPVLTPNSYPLKKVFLWIISKHVRIISIGLLVIFSIFLYWFEGSSKSKSKFSEAFMERKGEANSLPSSAALLPNFPSSTQNLSSEFKDFLSYLKSIEQQGRYDEGAKMKEEPIKPNEKLPMLPLPQPVSGAQ